MSVTETCLLLGLLVLVVVAFPLKGIGRAWDALVRLFEETRDSAASGTPVGEGCCVACGSDDVEILAPGVYVCRACGYQGGENRAAWERGEKQAAWGARPWAERIAAARGGVEDTQRQLLALESDARRWPNPEVVDAYASTSNPNAGFDLASNYLEVRRVQRARQALLEAIRKALAPLYAAADAVPGLAIPPPDDPRWDGEPDEVFARTQATTTGAFVAWPDQGSPYALDLATKTWTRLSARWRYLPKYNVFILVSSVDEDVYFYKDTRCGG